MFAIYKSTQSKTQKVQGFKSFSIEGINFFFQEARSF
jgi:hypothetical protein